MLSVRSPSLALCRLSSLACVMLVLEPACGARSPLELPEACAAAGLTRPCFDACGAGTQACEDGFWQACVVAEVERACANECGSGTQSCSAGVWEECQVEIAERACANECGSGVEECRDGAWRGCEVPPATRPCDSACGIGTDTCSEGAWGGCEVPPVMVPCESVCGTGFEICSNGSWHACDAPLPGPPKLTSTIRDFRDEHPDFELPITGQHVDLGMLESVLGADEKPVYAGNPSTSTTSGRENFDQWYRDVPGVNQSQTIEIQLRASAETAGLFVYESTDFFPIDDQLFGNEGRNHNYHFTLEARTEFDYIGGEVFSFTGDDDMWVFINHRLAIDLGGVHSSLSASVSLDEVQAELGIVPGQRYPLHFFFAERHTVESNFTIRTSIAESGDCP